ncbi:cyclopropane-fatty-acyl-phospholipid synthase family protein [Nocardia sp. CDC159]|uniref:Cyclopropane-fatty-acyl-phospholipid synthase family protein n=1 Tax=Nocardia pulmonis TaxID=2951408 RepID=A0A9X2E686_9NOCA|nr:MULTISPECIES: cyclopropane-fatty-acyl-phospholipid synthase family protein [Nocardia]MCM6774559.1 cyclopropane-fatty-acyl-phospholipid synthase family protein [Nocardia pulmonis]MCM6787376.1 cyclopropane-fatty-acyl-phospholipid synthase family protein [Nocardia sp. CDC159]
MTETIDTQYQGASQQAIRSHYDIGNDFYALWLDPTRTYSCALWDGEDDTLQRAQERKLDFYIDHIRAVGAERVLDVGCGWGSMLRRLVEKHGVTRVVGLTLSDAQVDHIRTWADDRYAVAVQNWADHRPDAPYDAIVSLGAFEHFADMGLSRAGRVEAYRRFFQCCHDWLAPGGRLGLQTNVKGNNVRMSRAAVRNQLFIIDRIFTESELPWPSEILEASERLFDVVVLRNEPDQYIRTCRAWLEALNAAEDRALAMVGPEVVADYRRYLEACIEGFEHRHLGLVRVVFEKI